MDNHCILSVAGQGKIETEADTLVMVFKISRHDKTTAIAREKIITAVNKLLKELNNFGINNENIEISPMNMNSYWDDYTSNDRQLIQYIDQAVTCVIYDIKSNLDKINKIVDFIASFDEEFTYSQTFHLRDTSEIIKKCKELAFNDAIKNAEEYAKIAKHRIKIIVKISEFEPAERASILPPMYDKPPEEETSIASFSIKKIETIITLYLDFILEKIID